MEKFLTKPRHIEIQILADEYGNVIYLGERDCSMQRRHQKIIEEAPAIGITQEMREQIGHACIQACKKIKYRGAGTFEFLFEDVKFYFIEMNTRVQVEHTITEMITGIDIVKEQYINHGKLDYKIHIYAVGRVGSPANMMVSHDGGITWISNSMNNDCKMLFDIKMFDKNNGFVCAASDDDMEKSNALILKTSDG
jgi:hypothetical protein